MPPYRKNPEIENQALAAGSRLAAAVKHGSRTEQPARGIDALIEQPALRPLTQIHGNRGRD